MHRVFVLHSNRLLRDCLVDCLNNSKLDASSVEHEQRSSVAELGLNKADILIVDLQLPDGLALAIIGELRSKNSQTKVILLVPEEHSLLLECISAGVDGCVLERSSLTELADAINSVIQGEIHCSAEFAKRMFSAMSSYRKTPAWTTPKETVTCRLTLREREILELIANRKCNKEIAKELDLSLFTVKNHVHNILEKLNVGSRVEAVDLAQRDRTRSSY